jgi:C_GCAxxG_C_C family probable redox protein
VTKAWQPEFDEGLVRIANPFVGGIAGAGDLCGALAGGLMVIGYLFGRTSPEESQILAWGLSRKYHKAFQEAFGSTICREISEKVFNREGHVRGSLTVRESVATLWKLLEETDAQGQRSWLH